MVKTGKGWRGVLSRLASPIAAVNGLFDGGAGDKASPAAKAEDRPAGYADDEIGLTLEQFLEQQGGRFSVKLHIVSMVEFREAVGDRWRKLRDKVMMIAESTIHKHLGQGNMASRQGEDLFVLVFPKLPEDQGRHRAFVIAKELGARLLGNSRFAAGEEPLVHVAALDPAEAIGPDGALNLAALEKAIATVRVDAPRGGGDDDLPAYLRAGAAMGDEGGLRAHLKPGETAPAEDGPQEMRYHMKPGEAPPPSAPDGGLRRSMMPSQPRSEADAAPSEPAKPVEPPRARLLAEHLSMTYRPTWVAATESIAAYLALAQRHDKGKPLAGEHAFVGASEEETAMLDCFAAKAVAAQLVQMKQKITLILPVHASTLTGARLRDLRAILATVPHPVRILRLVVEICGLPADMVYAASLLNHIKDECREVALRTGIQGLPGGLGAAMAGLDLSMSTPADRADDRLLPALSAFHNAVRQSGYQPYVWGLPSRAALVAAVADGCSLVNGPALIKDVPEPNRLIPAPKARLLG